MRDAETDIEATIADLEAELATVRGRLAKSQADTLTVRGQLEQQTATYRTRVERLLNTLGRADVCKECRAVIFWCETKNGKAMPVGLSALPHFLDCPARKES